MCIRDRTNNQRNAALLMELSKIENHSCQRQAAKVKADFRDTYFSSSLLEFINIFSKVFPPNTNEESETGPGFHENI